MVDILVDMVDNYGCQIKREELQKQQSPVFQLCSSKAFGLPELNLTLGQWKWERTKILLHLRSVPGFGAKNLHRPLLITLSFSTAGV